jgi:hypothetical protein
MVAPPNGTTPPWPSAEALVALWNETVPSKHPKVKTLSPKRRRKTNEALRMCPDLEFWKRAFGEVALSEFLQGRKNGPGHENFKFDFDWFTGCGKDGIENAVKAEEGKYRNQRPADEDEE